MEIWGGGGARKTFHKRLNYLIDISQEYNLKVVDVDTNINEFLMQIQEKTHTFRTLSTILALQKLFKIYYYGSGLPFYKFHFEEHDPAYYDLLNMVCLSTDNISFYSSGGETTRLGKLKEISTNNIAHEYLNVCIAGGIPNCGKCEKCRRTMMGWVFIQ